MAPIDPDPIHSSFGLKSTPVTGSTAIVRLLSIAVGLKSVIWGESAILSQFESAIRRSFLDPELSQLLGDISSLAREIRVHTDFFSGDHATIGIEYVQNLFDESFFARRTVFIIGSGMLALSAAKALAERGCQKVVILTDSERAAELRFNDQRFLYANFSFLGKVSSEERFFIITAAGKLRSNNIVSSIDALFHRLCDGCLDLMSPSLFSGLSHDECYVNLSSEDFLEFISYKNQNYAKKRLAVERFVQDTSVKVAYA